VDQVREGEVTEVPFNPLAQYKPMIPRKLPRMMTTPQDEIVGLRNDRQFFVIFANGHHHHALLYTLPLCKRRILFFDPYGVPANQYQRQKAVKP